MARQLLKRVVCGADDSDGADLPLGAVVGSVPGQELGVLVRSGFRSVGSTAFPTCQNVGNLGQCACARAEESGCASGARRVGPPPSATRVVETAS